MRTDLQQKFSWSGSVEELEDRLVMSADPLGGLLGGEITHHSFVDDLPMIEHHAQSEADFWIDYDNLQSTEEELGQVEQSLADAHDQTGLSQVRTDYGFDGTGQTVAIIDSGIAYDHVALGGGFGQNFRVEGGWDFTGENDSNPYDDGPLGSHGTHVTGIVGGDDGDRSGVAPGANLVGLRVFDDAGVGEFSWVEDALTWIHDNRNSFEYPITTVNLSISSSGWNSDTIPNWANLEEELAQLEADGIFIAVAAGDAFTAFDEPGLSYPAASSHVVPVMSTNDDGLLSFFSQRHNRAIAAPGRDIISTVPDYAGNNNSITDDYASFSGTSMAAPYIAGASVIIREAMEFVGYTNITQQTIYDHMIATADSFFDSATNANYNRLNLEAAIDALMPTDDFGSTVGTAFDLGTLGSDTSMSGVITTLDDVDYFTFTAASTGSVTFTAANMTHDIAANWDVSGGTGVWSGANNEILTIDVVTGQEYSVGFSSQDGLGYYDLQIEAGSTLAAPEPLITAAVSSTQASLSWTDVDNETGYRIYLWTAEAPTAVIATVSADVTSYDATNLTPGSRNWFYVEAFSAASDARTSWSLAELPLDPPVAPTGFAATPTSADTAQLVWNDSTGETEYQIYRWSSADDTVLVDTVAANTTSYDVTNLPSSSRQWFYVSAVNESGEARTSWELAEIPLDPPTAPTGFAATPTSADTAQLVWNDSTGETEYQIYRWSSADDTVLVDTVAANTTSYDVTNLASGSRQWFYVSAVNESGEARTSWELAEMPTVPLADIQSFSSLSVSVISATEAGLSWTDTSGEDGYRVYRWSSADGLLLQASLPADSNSYTAFNLPANSRQWFYVQAFAGESTTRTSWQLAEMPMETSALSVASALSFAADANLALTSTPSQNVGTNANDRIRALKSHANFTASQAPALQREMTIVREESSNQIDTTSLVGGRQRYLDDVDAAHSRALDSWAEEDLLESLVASEMHGVR